MRTLVVYDSKYGNTKIVAEVIGEAIGGAMSGEVQVLPVDKVSANDIDSVDLLILGSPTHGALPSQPVQDWLAGLGSPAREGTLAATFDTRLTWPFLEGWGGFAAPKMAATLREKGWTLRGEPGGFFVKGLKKGPLKPGEVDRAAAWAKGLVEGQT